MGYFWSGTNWQWIYGAKTWHWVDGERRPTRGRAARPALSAARGRTPGLAFGGRRYLASETGQDSAVDLCDRVGEEGDAAPDLRSPHLAAAAQRPAK